METVRIPSAVIETLRRVQALAETRGMTCYLVGGWLRDQRLGRSPAHLNVDLVVDRGALPLCRALAEHLRGAFVPLDEAAGTARVVVSTEAGPVELDLSDFRGPTLEEDLRHRDFTVNAMAMALGDWLRGPRADGPFIDPLGGLLALARKELVACHPDTFSEDPVRMLRAFRFAAQLEFTVDPAMTPQIARCAGLLAGVSGERVRDELMAILETDRAASAIDSLNELGVLDVVFPELVPGRGMHQGGFHHLDVLGHQVETVSQTDRFLSDFAEFSEALRAPLAGYCAERLAERRSRKGLIKLAGLLHDVGKPARRTVEPDGEIWFLGHEQTGAELVEGVTGRLRLSNRESSMVRQLVLHHLRPGFLSREPLLTRRAIYRFFKELEGNGPGCLLTWWADRLATRGEKSRLDQIGQQRARLEELLGAYFFKAEEVVKPRRLLTGCDVMRAFQLKEGPLIGELLEAIEEAQAEGGIRTAEEALELASRLLQEKGRRREGGS